MKSMFVVLLLAAGLSVAGLATAAESRSCGGTAPLTASCAVSLTMPYGTAAIWCAPALGFTGDLVVTLSVAGTFFMSQSCEVAGGVVLSRTGSAVGGFYGGEPATLKGYANSGHVCSGTGCAAGGWTVHYESR